MSSRSSFHRLATSPWCCFSVALASGIGLTMLSSAAGAQNGIGGLRQGPPAHMNAPTVSRPNYGMAHPGGMRQGIPNVNLNGRMLGNGGTLNGRYLNAPQSNPFGSFQFPRGLSQGQRNTYPLGANGRFNGQLPYGAGSRSVPYVNRLRQTPDLRGYRNNPYYGGQHFGEHHHGESGGTTFYAQWGGAYFADSCGYYPNYMPYYVGGVTALSPYAFYTGIVPSYIDTNYVSYTPPLYVYVPTPVYVDGAYHGWQPDPVDGYYLNQSQEGAAPPSSVQPPDNGQGNGGNPATDGAPNAGDTPGRSANPLQPNSGYRVQENKDASLHEAGLDKAVTDIKQAWTGRDMSALSRHIRSDGHIAVYLRGHYQYSITGSDYLDMTKDAFRSTTTVSFTLDDVQRKENGIYTVSGSHVYRDKQDKERTVHLSYVLQKEDDKYNIIQIGATPDHIEE